MIRTLPWFAATVAVAATTVGAADPVSFRADIAPILRDRCLGCHDAATSEGGFRVDTYQLLSEKGDSAAAGLTAGAPEQSELLRRIETDDEFERMPLDADPLPDEQIEMVRRWIQAGAKFDGPDPSADLVSVIPPPTHPDPPEVYPFPVPVTAVVFGPEGRELIAGGYHELTVWNPEDGSLVDRIGNVGQRTRALSLSPDGEWLAVGGGAPGRSGETRLVRLRDREVVRSLGSTSDEVTDVAFNPAGDRLAVASADGMIRVFAVPGGEEQKRLTSHADFVLAIAWSPDGSKLVSGSRDKTSKVFDANSGDILATYSGHGEPVTCVAFHPGGKHVYSGGRDSKVHRWKVTDGKKVGEFAMGGPVLAINAHDGSLVVSAADGTARSFDAKSFKPIRSFEGHGDWVTALGRPGSSNRIATGTFDGFVTIWDAEGGEQLIRFSAAPGHRSTPTDGPG